MNGPRITNLLMWTILFAGALRGSGGAQTLPTPVLTSVTPNQAPAGSLENITLTLRGSGFFPGSAVQVGQTLETTFINETTLTAILNPSRFGGPSVQSVVVVNRSSTGDARQSGSLRFYLYPPNPPVVSSSVAKVRQLSYQDPTQVPAMIGATGGSTETSFAGTNLVGASVAVSGAGVTVAYGAFPDSLTEVRPSPFVYLADPVSSSTSQIRFSVAPDATLGPRLVTFSTPSGATSQCGDQPCTFTVIDGGKVSVLPPGPGISGAGYSATQLIDGRVLVAGGGANNSSGVHAALFDPASGSWGPAGDLITDRHSHAAVLLPDGRVLVAGGIKNNGTPTSSVEIYDASTGRWTAGPAMPKSSGPMTGWLLTSGRVGLWGSSTYDEYDPATGTFDGTAAPDIVPDPRRIARNLKGTVLIDGRVLVRSNINSNCFSLRCPAPTMAATIYSPVVVNGTLTNGPFVPAAAPLDGPGMLLSSGQVLISSSAGNFLYDSTANALQPAAGGLTPLTLLSDGGVFAAGQIYTPPGLSHPAPEISAIMPQISASETHPIAVVITGDSFLPNSAVRLRTRTLVSLFLTANTLVAFVPPSERSAFDPAAMTVSNPAPGGGTASVNGVIAAPPLITGISPSAGNPGTQVVAVLSGRNLSGPVSIAVSGAGTRANIETGGTDTELPLTIVVDPDAPLGKRSITLTTSGGSYTLESAFSIQAARPGIPSTVPQTISEVEQGIIQSGYIIITPAANSAAPLPIVTYGIVHGGLVQSQAGILAAAMTLDAATFVEVIPGIGRDLGVAVANPGDGINVVTLTLIDESGMTAGFPVTLTLQPHQQSARFVRELFGSDAIGAGFRGSMHLQSATPFTVVGLRFSGIEFSTLPLSATAAVAGVPSREVSGTVGGANAWIIPQFAMSGGWATQIGLVNSTGAAIGGRVPLRTPSCRKAPLF
jgi:hypothetical protein